MVSQPSEVEGGNISSSEFKGTSWNRSSTFPEVALLKCFRPGVTGGGAVGRSLFHFPDVLPTPRSRPELGFGAAPAVPPPVSAAAMAAGPNAGSRSAWEAALQSPC